MAKAKFAISSSRTLTWKLEFADSGGMRWNLIRRTIHFMNVLLRKRLQNAIEQGKGLDDEGSASILALEKPMIVNVKSKVKGAYRIGMM